MDGTIRGLEHDAEDDDDGRRARLRWMRLRMGHPPSIPGGFGFFRPLLSEDVRGRRPDRVYGAVLGAVGIHHQTGIAVGLTAKRHESAPAIRRRILTVIRAFHKAWVKGIPTAGEVGLVRRYTQDGPGREPVRVQDGQGRELGVACELGDEDVMRVVLNARNKACEASRKV